MNFKKKALLPAIAMVLVSVIALTGVSYAWFTMSDTAEVGTLDIAVESAAGIQISADCTNFSSKIDLNKIKDATDGSDYNTNINVIPTGAIYPVSTAGNLVAVPNSNASHAGKFYMQMFSGDIINDTLSSSALVDYSTGAAPNYLAFDLFIKLDEDNTTIYLDEGTDITTADGKNTNYAARVAFINLGTAAERTDAMAITGDSTSPVCIWEPYADKHIGEVTETGRLTTEGISSVSGTTPTTTAVTPWYVTNDGETISKNLFTLNKGYTKVRVYVWLEGQDADCLNSVSGDTLRVNLKFKRSTAQ